MLCVSSIVRNWLNMCMRTKSRKQTSEVTQMLTVGSRTHFGLKEQDVQVLEPRSLKNLRKEPLGLGDFGLLRWSCYPVGASGAWAWSLDGLRLEFWMGVLLADASASWGRYVRLVLGVLRKQNRKTSEDQRSQLLPPDPLLTWCWQQWQVI